MRKKNVPAPLTVVDIKTKILEELLSKHQMTLPQFCSSKLIKTWKLDPKTVRICLNPEYNTVSFPIFEAMYRKLSLGNLVKKKVVTVKHEYFVER